MELLGLVIIWPLILLIVGFVFVSAASAASWLALLAVIFFFILVFGMSAQLSGATGAGATAPKVISEAEQLDRVRRGAIAFSIALLLPIFVQYLLDASGRNLPTMILALVIGFGALVWGMFAKGNHVLTYANVMGGAFVIIYLYFELWSLGQLAQIVATAFGLVAAIIISVVKFRDKLS